jgi:hypothetical protein
MARFSVHASDNDNDDDEPALPCSQKLAFDTLRQAAAAANVAEYQHGASLKPYRCDHCGLWHLASA